MLIYQPSRERSFYNFHAPPLPMIVLWCKYATRAISRNSETATFFARTIAQANIPALGSAGISACAFGHAKEAAVSE